MKTLLLYAENVSSIYYNRCRELQTSEYSNQKEEVSQFEDTVNLSGDKRSKKEGSFNYIFMFANETVGWRSKNKDFASQSTDKAKYLAWAFVDR